MVATAIYFCNDLYMQMVSLSAHTSVVYQVLTSDLFLDNRSQTIHNEN